MLGSVRIWARITYLADSLRWGVMGTTIRIGAKGDLTGSFATLVRNTTWFDVVGTVYRLDGEENQMT